MSDKTFDGEKIKKLPEPFLEAMKGLLGDSYEDFLLSFNEKPRKGLLFNSKKARKETVEKLISQWKLEPVEWCEGGYRYDEDLIRPGKSPYHDAGVFYMQEPSAMISAAKADIRDTDAVLDLCAAPGGKSAQAAQKAGILISNEIIEKRARVLSSNIERLGFSNVIVCSAAPSELSRVFPGFFDRIIVDAPCSGEGMFRKDDRAIEEWSLQNVERCIERQREILEAALLMLKPGGKMVYSTCTFEPYENKWQLRRFCDIHADELELKEFRQLYPHEIEGEGHFYGVIERSGDDKDGQGSFGSLRMSLEETADMMRRNGIHVLRAGIEKGIIKKDRKGNVRYEASHAEAMKAGDPAVKPYIDLKTEDLARRYLTGESLRLQSISEESYELCSEGGELRVLYDGYPLGLGKLSQGTLKNKLPKGLRRV